MARWGATSFDDHLSGMEHFVVSSIFADHEIRGCVVEPVSVDVMDYCVTWKRPPEGLLGYEAIFSNALPVDG